MLIIADENIPRSIKISLSSIGIKVVYIYDENKKFMILSISKLSIY